MRLESINEKTLSPENKEILKGLKRAKKEWYEEKRK